MADSPPRRSIISKVWLGAAPGVVLCVAIATGIAGIVSWREQKADLQRQVEQIAVAQADALALPVWSYDDRQVERLLKVTASTPEVVAVRLLGLDRRQIAAAGRGDPDPRSTITQERPIMVSSPTGSRQLGIIEIAMSTDSIDRQFERSLLATLTTTLAVLAVLFILIVRSMRRLVLAPLTRLTDVMRHVADRDWMRVGVTSNDEIGAVAASFDRMVDDLVVGERTARRNEALRLILAAAEVETDDLADLLDRTAAVLVEVAGVQQALLALSRSNGSQRFSATRGTARAKAVTVETAIILDDQRLGEIRLTAEDGEGLTGLAGIVGSILKRSLIDLERRENLRIVELERRRSESMLQYMLRAQEEIVRSEKLASLGQLVAGVAHEINTPIGICLSSSSFLTEQTAHFAVLAQEGKLRRTDVDDHVATSTRLARLIQVNAERAADLIQSFKSVSIDQTHEQRRVIDLESYIREIVASLRPPLRRAGAAVTIIFTQPVELDTYPGAVAQVMTNLIMNAIEHGFIDRGHGTITIAVGPSDAPGMIDLHVADDGPGIPAENLKRIFDPFFTTRRGAGGTGLGLHIVHNIVASKLGGRIIVRNRPEGGAEFLITIPTTEDARARERTEASTNG